MIFIGKKAKGGGSQSVDITLPCIDMIIGKWAPTLFTS